VRGIAIRDELTNEWKKRGVKEHLEYAILTAEISRATFGMTPSEYCRGGLHPPTIGRKALRPYTNSAITCVTI
jgi:hypothetical protein